MDFLKLLRGIEELLFEALSWLIFYPLTLWRVLVSPVKMMDYSDIEQADSLEGSYSDTFSPGLFLIVTLLLVHGIELALGIEADFGGALGEIVKSSDENILITRTLTFGIYPLIFSMLLLIATKVKIDRNSLRAPFFAQCYTTSTFALLVNIGFLSIQMHAEPSTIMFAWAWELAVVLWLITIQTLWFRHETGMGLLRATAISIGGFLSR